VINTGNEEPNAETGQEAGMADEGRGMKLGRKRNVSFVGTADYIAPETLESTSCSCGVDLWALGCVIYQMLHGRTPFRCVPLPMRGVWSGELTIKA
jgi:serine/threonine protein kinase